MASRTNLTLHLKVTTHECDKATGNREAKATSSMLTCCGWGRLGEAVKYTVECIGRDTCSGVDNGNGEPV